MVNRRDLDKLIDSWIEVAGSTSVRDLGESPGLNAGLANGGAGIAYTLWRLGVTRNDVSLFDAGARWIKIARRAARKPNAFRHRELGTSARGVMYGPIGIEVVAALLAHSRGEKSRGPIATLAANTRRRIAVAPAECIDGIAGRLLAAIALARVTRDALVTELANDLLARLDTLPLPRPGGFAHGDIGVLFARLSAARWRGARTETAMLGPLPIDVLGRPGRFNRSWCNGLAGIILWWVLAAESTGEDRFRARALSAAPHLLDELDEAGGSLCCGLGGRAYALLAVSRIDPEGPWIERATALATRALSHELGPGGMLKGFPGLIGLVDDLQRPSAARFPLIDVAS